MAATPLRSGFAELIAAETVAKLAEQARAVSLTRAAKFLSEGSYGWVRTGIQISTAPALLTGSKSSL